MTLTHASLLAAVRAAGRDRESFTCADVRQQLGLSTEDRQQMNRFYSRFRALQKDAASEIEKLGSNCYRLRARADVPPASDAPAPIAAEESAQPAAATPLTEQQDLAANVAAPALVTLAAQTYVASVETPEPAPNDVEVLAAPLAREHEAGAPESVALVSDIAAPAEHAERPRVPWFSRMTRFFSRRGADKRAASPGVAMGL